MLPPGRTGTVFSFKSVYLVEDLIKVVGLEQFTGPF